MEPHLAPQPSSAKLILLSVSGFVPSAKRPPSGHELSRRLASPASLLASATPLSLSHLGQHLAALGRLASREPRLRHPAQRHREGTARALHRHKSMRKTRSGEAALWRRHAGPVDGLKGTGCKGGDKWLMPGVVSDSRVASRHLLGLLPTAATEELWLVLRHSKLRQSHVRPRGTGSLRKKTGATCDRASSGAGSEGPAQPYPVRATHGRVEAQGTQATTAICWLSTGICRSTNTSEVSQKLLSSDAREELQPRRLAGPGSLLGHGKA